MRFAARRKRINVRANNAVAVQRIRSPLFQRKRLANTDNGKLLLRRFDSIVAEKGRRILQAN
jgi:hypothetical protein